MNIVLILIGVLAIASGLYQYDQTHGFNATFNPAMLFFSIMALVGIAGVIGQLLTKLDIKKGYCDLGISEAAIRRYREKHNIDDPYKMMREQHNASDNGSDRQ